MWQAIWNKIQAEPNSLSELVRQGMFLLLGFEVIRWTDAQQGLALAFVSALLTFIVRGKVIPAVTIVQAGQSVSQIKSDASAAVAQQEATKTQVEATRQQDQIDKSKEP